MPSFDPTALRQEASGFRPPRPPRFQDLTPAKEVIVELRQRRASYRAIAEFLTQHSLPASKSAVAAFCHELLGEVIRPRRKAIRKRVPAGAAQNHTSQEKPATLSQPALTHPLGTPPPFKAITAPGPSVRGPRIAQVRMIKPQNP